MVLENLTIRPATIADEAMVSGVLAESYASLWQDHYSRSDLDVLLPLITRAQPQLLESGRFFVAISNRQCAGCGGWSLAVPGRTDEIIPGTGHVRHFAVHPDHLRKGVGRALYSACLAQARNLGLVRMEAWSSLQAVPFYAGLGFREIEPLTIDFPDGIALQSVRMIADPA